MSPVLLASYYSAKLNAAREEVARTIAERKSEYDACLRGEGCPADLEAAEAAFLGAQQQYDELRTLPFLQMMGGATRDLHAKSSAGVSKETYQPVNLFVQLGLATIELVSVVVIMATGVMMLQLMQYDAAAGVDGSGTNMAVYSMMAEMADKVP